MAAISSKYLTQVAMFCSALMPNFASATARSYMFMNSNSPSDLVYCARGARSDMARAMS